MPASAARPSRVRHLVLAFTVAAYLITYMDRVVISTAAPSMQKAFGLSLVAMGWIFGAFQFSYAIFQIPGGWLGDRFGPRRALSGVVLWWSAFTAATAFTWSAGSLLVCRFLFGAGEAGAFPIATRSLSRWMLPSERGAAQGLTHAGARLGGAATPVLVVALIAALGWRAPFVIFAVVGVAWAALWFWFYRDAPAEHPLVNAAERKLIADALGAGTAAKQAPPWKALLGRPQLWILSAMYVCYAFDMGVFLTWFPKYLNDARGFSLAQMGLYASLPLAAGVVGDVAGGWISDRLVERLGLTLGRRLVAVVGYGMSAVAIPLACYAHDPMASVAFFCLAVFGLELTVGVSWAVTLDVGGAFAGSVSAVMNTFGNLGGAFASALTGYLVTAYGWTAPFLVLATIAGLGGVLFLWLDAGRPLVPTDAASAGAATFEAPVAAAGEAS